MNRLSILRIVLGIICFFHLLLGVLAFAGLPGQVGSTVAAAYGASISTVDVNPQLQHVIRMLGAYMIAIGVLAALSVLDPFKNRIAIDVLILLFLERVVQRILFATEIRNAFNMTPGRLWFQTGFFLIFPIVLFILRPRSIAPHGGSEATRF